MNELFAAAIELTNRNNSMPMMNYIIIGAAVLGGLTVIVIVVAALRYFKHTK